MDPRFPPPTPRQDPVSTRPMTEGIELVGVQTLIETQRRQNFLESKKWDLFLV